MSSAFDAFESFHPVLRKELAVILENGLRVALHGAKRRAHVVRNAIRESLQFGHRLAQLGGALSDSLFEKLRGPFALGDIARETAGIEQFVTLAVHGGVNGDVAN